MSSVDELIKCSFCKNVLNTPVILPCGESICNEHVNQDGMDFNCPSCSKIHQVPADGFINNVKLEKLINSVQQKSNLDKDYLEAAGECRKLDAVMHRVSQFEKESLKFISEGVYKLRCEVQNQRDELKSKIDQQVDRLMEEIDEYENNCRSNFESEDGKYDLSLLADLVQVTNETLDSWLGDLETAEQNSSNQKWNEVKTGSQSQIKQLNQRIALLKEKYLIYDNKQVVVKEAELKLLSKQPNMFKDSTILDIDLSGKLTDLCRFPPNQQWKLLYRASLQGFGAKDFHHRCDFKKPTLSIIKSESGNIFGGYTEQSWDFKKKGSTTDYSVKSDPAAFIFSLINREKTPFKMNIRNEGRDAILCGENFLMVFGYSEGNDIVISDPGKFGKDNNRSDLAISTSFAYEGNKKLDLTNELLAGTRNFVVADIEVYQKI